MSYTVLAVCLGIWLTLFSGCVAQIKKNEPLRELPSLTGALDRKDIAYELFIRARQHELSGEVDESVRLYEEVVKIDTEAVSVMDILLQRYLSTGRLKEALAILDVIYPAQDSSVVRGKLYAQLLFRSARFTDLEKLILRLKKDSDATDYEVLDLEYLLAETAKDTALAIRTAKALSQKPEYAITAYERLISQYVRSGDCFKALDPATRLIEKFVYSPSLRYALFKLAESGGACADSILVLVRKAAETITGGNKNQVFRDLATMQIGFGMLDSAETTYRNLLRIGGGVEDLKIFGHFLHARGRFLAAESLLKIVVLQRPDPDSYFFLGAAQLSLNKLDSSIASFLASIALDSSNKSVYLNLALAYLRNEKPDSALLFLNKNRAIAPLDDCESLYFTAVAYESKKDYANAAQFFRRASEADTLNYESIFRWGASEERRGNFSKAESLLSLVILRDTMNHRAYNYLSYMYADSGIKLEEAEKLVGRALYLDSLNSAYMDTYGWILYKMGGERLNNALIWLKKAYANSDGKDVEILEHLAEIYDKLGRTSEAADFWTKIIKLDSKNDKAKNRLEKIR